jgi:hypothetical protein
VGVCTAGFGRRVYPMRALFSARVRADDAVFLGVLQVGQRPRAGGPSKTFDDDEQSEQARFACLQVTRSAGGENVGAKDVGAAESPKKRMSLAKITELLEALTKKVDNVEATMATMATKADVEALKCDAATKADVGRLFESALIERIAREYGAKYARPFLANSSYGLVRLSTVKRHGVGDVDGTKALEKDTRAFAKFVALEESRARFALAAKCLQSAKKGSDKTEVTKKLIKEMVTVSKLKEEADVHGRLGQCNGLAVGIACSLAFKDPLCIANAHASTNALKKAALRTQLEADCRGDVEEHGDVVAIRMGEVKSGDAYLYAVHQLSQALVLRAFVHWVVHGQRPTVSYTLTGTVFCARGSTSRSANATTVASIVTGVKDCVADSVLRSAINLHVSVMPL